MTLLTRSFKETVVEHLRINPSFRTDMVEEAARNFSEGDICTALSRITNVVEGTMGMKVLADMTGIPLKDLVVILYEQGNTDIARFRLIVSEVSRYLGGPLIVWTEPVSPESRGEDVATVS